MQYHGPGAPLPLHPIAAMENLAWATPAPCEGSRGHLRDQYAHETGRDFYDAVECHDRVLRWYDSGWTFERIRRACVQDALLALRNWTAEDRNRELVAA